MAMKPLTLDSSSPTPLHAQFTEQLKKRISKGHWRAGEKIPSEREFMELTNLSRATVRQALGSLVQQGVLEKTHGAGTFVATPKIEQPMNTAYSFSEQLKALGFALGDELIERRLIKADAELAKRLQLRKGAKVIYLHRLRTIDGTPFMVSKAYIPYLLCPGLLEEPINTTLYKLLVERYQLPVVKATDKVEALQPSRDMVKQLKTPLHVPILFVERLATTTHERILHLGLNYIRGDKCFFRVDLSAQASVLELKP
jgi:GntR family transcriptional regulator